MRITPKPGSHPSHQREGFELNRFNMHRPLLHGGSSVAPGLELMTHRLRLRVWPGPLVYRRSSVRDAEIILRAGQIIIISEINILVENSQGSSHIPKSNPQLLNAEIKKKITRHENIKSMSFTRNGKIRFSTLEPVCAAQILSLEKILNVSVKTNILWEGITSRFLIYEIPLDISLNEIAKELQETNDFEIIEMRRFIKTGSHQQFSPILVTILGTTLPETVKLWFINHRIQNFIDKPRQCTTPVLVFFILLDFAKKL
ncbi:uncharacterized protein TNCV_3727851 [Trichonephila clavipes]|uniref:Uncharacterized protein n=1 Tax=Trichonephila clavipes TaxID=2585209 RepID=A0A8X6R1B4_TRICX|nr:uncharacterized protein TNCV_3727851 [Trichonephila clavipes]